MHQSSSITLLFTFALIASISLSVEHDLDPISFQSLATTKTFCDVLKSVQVLDISSKVSSCVSSKNPNYGQTTPSHGAVAVVSYREMLIGCYAFERYLLPNTETIFVFDEDFVKLWRLDEFVASATRAQTLGAHLVITSVHAGDAIAKRIALEFIDQFAPVEFLFALNCDVHEMPTTYVGYSTFSTMINELSKVYRSEKALRKNKKSNVENASKLGEKAFNPILAINTVQVEDRQARLMHGVDVSNWISRGGIKGKPKSLGTKPWFSDSTFNVETHIMLMDVAVLKSIASLYFVVDSINPEQLTVPLTCNLRNLAVLRHNEHVIFLDFVTNGQLLKSSYYTKYLTSTQMNYMLLRSFELVAERRNPKYVYDELHAFNNVGIRMPQQYGLGFVARNFRPHWVPSLVGRSATNPLVVRMINATMKLGGYSYLGTNTSNGFSLYFASMCYPQSVPMLISSTAVGDNVVARFNYKNSSLFLISNFQYRVQFPRNSVSQRTIPVPIFDDSIVQSMTSTVTNRFNDMSILKPRSEFLKSPVCPAN